MAALNVKFELDNVDELKSRRGLDGTAQKKLDTEVMRVMEPYMPKLYGNMIQSMEKATDIGSGEIIVNTPYAHRRLKSARKNGLRGPNFFERMKADNLDHLKRFIGKQTGGEVK